MDLREIKKWLALGVPQEEVRSSLDSGSDRSEFDTICRQLSEAVDRVSADDRDRSVDWNKDKDRLVSEVFSPDHLHDVRQVDAHVRLLVQSSLKADDYPRATLRSVRWISYVFTYAPSIINPLDVWATAMRFATQDWLSEVVPEDAHDPSKNHPLVDWIEYAPWTDGESVLRYTRALSEKRVDPVVPFYEGRLSTELLGSEPLLGNESSARPRVDPKKPGGNSTDESGWLGRRAIAGQIAELLFSIYPRGAYYLPTLQWKNVWSADPANGPRDVSDLSATAQDLVGNIFASQNAVMNPPELADFTRPD